MVPSTRSRKIPKNKVTFIEVQCCSSLVCSVQDRHTYSFVRNTSHVHALRRREAEVQYIAPFVLGGGERQFQAPATEPQRKGASVPVECKSFIKKKFYER